MHGRMHGLRAKGETTEDEMSTDLPSKLGAIEAATALFRSLGVPYALIGGVAVGIRSGVPRATLDVNFAVPTTTDMEALVEGFLERGFVFKGRFAHSVNFAHVSGEPVQLAFDAAFDAMIQRAETSTFEDVEVRIVALADLIVMKKRAAADPARRRSKALRDHADVALLEGDVPEPHEGW